ncbi:unnamed protein product [Sympodiomycopsis kandeliae]
MDQNFVQNLHNLLAQTSVPDTNVVKNATEALQKQYYPNSQCLPALFQIISTSQDLSVRQLAAVELRKQITKKNGAAWKKQPQDLRETIKAQLLEGVLKETSVLVRNAVSRVISQVADIELPLGTWQQLLPFLFQSSQSSNSIHRHIAIYIFLAILDTLSDSSESSSNVSLDQYLPQIMGVFEKSLQDPESLEVRITTVRALGRVAMNLEMDAVGDLQAMQNAVPKIVEILHQCLSESHTDGVKQVCDVLEEMCLLEAPVFGNHLPNLIQFLLDNSANQEHEESLRITTLNSIIWICSHKRSKIQTLNLAKPMITRLIAIATEEEPDDIDEDSPARLALRVIDELATELPPSHVFPPIFEEMQKYMSNSDAGHRKAALMAFGVSAEGCSEYIRPHMNELWPFIEAGLRDPELAVRKAACISLGCLCEVLDEECAARHATLLPMIMDLIAHEDTQRSACTALDSLLEVMGDDIAQYLHAIMERMAALLETAPLPVKSTIVGAIGSAAHASKAGFLPYFQQTMQRFQPFLLLKEDGDEQDLRGITTDTLGTMAEAVGKEHFRPYFETAMKIAFDAMSLESPRLRECSFIFFGVMSRVFGDEFAPYLQNVVPLLLASFKQAEHDAVPGASGNGVVEGVGAPGENGEDDDGFVDFEEMQEAFLNVNSAVAVEKEVAADSLGEIFTNTKQHFIPFMEQSVSELTEMLNHFYQGIRKSALSALFMFINTFNEISKPQEWKAGANPPVALDSSVKSLVDTVIPKVLEMWEEEYERVVAIEVCQSLADCLNKNGPAIIAPTHLEFVCQQTIMILEGKGPSQIDADGEEGEELTEGSEYESVLITAASDLVGALSTVLGADFQDPLKMFLPVLMKYYQPGRSASDRATVVGTLGEIIVGMKEHITPFTNDVLTLLSRALSDEDAPVRSNACFAAGVLVENSKEDLSQHYEALLNALRPMFERRQSEVGDEQSATDNAVGCAARLVSKKPDGLPLDQVLPVIFGCLPLKKDMAEWAPVLQALMTLVQSNNSVATSNIDTILQLFAHVLGQDGGELLDGQLRGQCVGFISALNSSIPEKIQQAGLSQYLV